MTKIDANPAQNIDAERGVLGSMLNSPRAVAAARLSLTAAAFYRPNHATLFELILELDDQGIRVEPAIVRAELARRRLLANFNSGTEVFDMWANTVYAGNVGYHARLVREAARVRQAEAVRARLTQVLDGAAATGETSALWDIAARSSVELQVLAEEPVQEGKIDGLDLWDDFIQTAAQDPNDWVVPGMLRKHDVFLILGGAGSGKSFLSRQVAASIAAGVHPFRLTRIEPKRTLLVDLENAPGQVAEESVGLLSQLGRLSHENGTGDRGWVWMHHEGLNIRKREDALLFERVIAEVRPDVVCFGSLYNAYVRGSDDWDAAATDVQEVLKKLRRRYGLAFWLEHHMVRAQGGTGHTGTPFGGTSWEKWPTHGRVLKRVAETAPLYALQAGTFRADRGTRDLPAGLRRGGQLPLTAIYDPDEFETEVDAANDGRRTR